MTQAVIIVAVVAARFGAVGVVSPLTPHTFSGTGCRRRVYGSAEPRDPPHPGGAIEVIKPGL